MVAFARAAEIPAETQHAKLMELLRRNADTEYGRRFGFATIRSPAEYAERVPLMSPLDLQPYVARMMKGERGILTADPPVYYTRSTGSSSAPKFVPVTDSYRVDFQRTVFVSLGHIYRRFPSAFLGRALYFVGSRRIEVAPDGNDVGTMSGYNFTELPALIRKIYAWPYELFTVEDLETRSYLSLHIALTQGVSCVGGIFPAPIVYLLRDLERRGPELARCLYDGTLPTTLKLPADQRAFFSRYAKARPDVAARVERALEGPAEAAVSTAFPMLRLVYCWSTSTAALYVPELKRRLGPRVAVRDAIYAATEGWCTIPMGDEEPGGPLALQSGYFEFIPADALAAGRTDVVPVEGLEQGRRYAIVLTTAVGAYRYLLGDVVEVNGFYKKTPRLIFVRRTGATSSLLGEKLDEVHVTEAVAAALSALELEATWFSLAPRLGESKPGYTLHLELPRRPAEALRAKIGAHVDEALGDRAADYQGLRRAGQLAAVDVHVVQPGVYDSFRQEKLREGAAEAQLKTAHLVAKVEELPERFRVRGGSVTSATGK